MKSSKDSSSWSKINDPFPASTSPSTSLSGSKNVGMITLDRVAFLLIRLKRAFNKRKSKSTINKNGNLEKKTKPPLLRARTLPAIITPSLNIIKAQLDANNDQSIEGKGNGTSLYQDFRLKRNACVNKARISFISEQAFNESEDFKSTELSQRNSLASLSSNASVNNKSKIGGLVRFGRFRQQSKEKLNADSPFLNNNSIQEVSCFSWSSNQRPTLKRSGSVDSFLESHYGSSHGINVAISDPDDSELYPPKNEFNVQYMLELQKLKSAKKQACLSPSFQQKIPKQNKRQGSIDFLFAESLNRAERKRLERLNKINFDVQALFTAVEHKQLERAKALLKSTDVDVNSVNSDGFTPLDIALVVCEVDMVNLLQSWGAKESTTFPNKEKRASHIQSLLKEAEKALLDLNAYLNHITTNGSLSTALVKKNERQKTFWVRRLQYLKNIESGFNLLEIPDKPFPAILEVIGSTSLLVQFANTKNSDSKRMLSKYKVEWSLNEDFSNQSQLQVFDIQKQEVVIHDLKPDSRYFVRVAAGNPKGYSDFCETKPAFATPSTWRSIFKKENRFEKSSLAALDKLFQEMIDSRPEHAAEVKGLSEECDTLIHQRKGQMRKSIRHLFTTAPKFQKVLKRGVYLACTFYYEDKILMTNEDNVPIVEVDETYPSASFQLELHWLLKVTCTWEDVKTLKVEMEKCPSSSTAHFRIKLLQAIELLQASLGMQDLGQLYYEPIIDAEGVIVIVTMKRLSDTKLVNNLSVKWVSMFKVNKRLSPSRGSEGGESLIVNPSAADKLLSNLKNIAIYNKASQTALPRGLYLGYVLMQSSMNTISILVSKSTPNVFPYAKIKDNPHVSKDEWQSILDWSLEENKNFYQTYSSLKEIDDTINFRYSILLAVRQLQKLLQIDDMDILNHRIMDSEIIEFSKDVTFILLLPQVENVCSILGKNFKSDERPDFRFQSVQVFENICMRTYQPNFLARCSRILSILEMDTMVAQQTHREAFSKCDLNSAKDRLTKLQNFQTRFDEIWRSQRWILDVINYARDKQLNAGIALNTLCDHLPDYEAVEETLPRLSISNILLSTSENHLQVNLTEKSCSTPNRRPSRDDSIIGLSTDFNLFNHLRIATSASSYSLLDVVHNQVNLESNVSSPESKSNEIRRCVSTSRLVTDDSQESSQSSKHENYLQVPTFIEDKVFKFGKDEATFCDVLALSEKRLLPPLEIETGPSKDTSNINMEKKRLSNGDIIRVYPTYESSFPPGTNVKVRIGADTRARDVLDLVIKQLNAIVKLKNLSPPSYQRDEWSDFDLVVFSENNFKIIPEDWKLIDLTDSWFRGKFCVQYKKYYC